MKRALTLALAATFIFAGAVQASPTGTLTIVSQTATSVTLLATADGAKLTLSHYCDAGDQYVGMESVSVQGSATVTFDIGPRKYHGALVTPTSCWANLYYVVQRAYYGVAALYTLP